MSNNLGAYIQHRWLNPRLPRQTAWDVRPVAAPIWGLGAIFGSGPVPRQLYTPLFAADFTGSGNMAVAPQRELFGSGARRGAAPGYNYPTAARVGVPRRQPLGSIFGSAFDQASETMDMLKIGVWIIGGGILGYTAGWLFRELRTANRRKNRKRRGRRMNSSSKRTFVIGDRVGYARQFLKNIGIGPTGEEWRWKGTIIGPAGDLPADRFSRVRWDHGHEVNVNNMNLAKIGSRAYVD